MSVAVAILAAGRGERFGGAVAKPLLRLRDRPLVAWALDAARASGLEPVLLIVGHRAVDVAGVVDAGVEVVPADGWERGIAVSLRVALDALEPRPEIAAVCIGLGDQPLVEADSYRRLVAAYHDGAELAVAMYHGRRGNPVLLGRRLWEEARALDGDEGARALMRTHPVVEVDCTGRGEPTDVDTLDDLERMEARCASKTASE